MRSLVINPKGISMVDRRDDIGSKVLLSTMTGILMLLVTMFINAAWSTANEGKNKAFEIGERMTSMEGKFFSIQGDLSEIKDLLKRKIPGGA